MFIKQWVNKMYIKIIKVNSERKLRKVFKRKHLKKAMLGKAKLY